jgi:serine/threonine protein kinase
VLNCALTSTSTEQDNHQYVLKDNPKGIHENFYERVKPNVRESPLIRLPVDEIPEQRIFVYNYLKEDLLSLVRKRIPLHTTRHILRESLRGIAELHDQDIVHLGTSYGLQTFIPWICS